MSNTICCPRCGNTEIAPDHNFCMICGLNLKENAPADVGASIAGAQSNNQVQDTPSAPPGQEACCKKCGRAMAWRGKVHVCCEHCGHLQCWPTRADR